MVTETALVGLVLVVAVQRLTELRHSRRNEARLYARGGREHAPRQMRWMKWVHVAWLASIPLEVFYLHRPFIWPLALGAMLLFLIGQGLRYAAMRGLGEHWSVRIITVPGAPVMTGGIYRWFRHPNYLGVVLEIAALPLIHGAWLSSLVFSALNGLVLVRRIEAEENALAADTEYSVAFQRRPRRMAPLRGED